MELPEIKAGQKPERNLLPETFKITTWEGLKPWYDALLDRNIGNPQDLKSWLKDMSELEAVVSEDLAWRYIRMTCYTENPEYSDQYEDFIKNIQPQIAPYSDKLNKKLMASEHVEALKKERGFDILVRNVEKDIEIYREENIPIYTEINKAATEYGRITGTMMVTLDGQEMTLQQAAVRLQWPDRSKREEAFLKINERRFKDNAQFDALFNKLIQLRHQVSTNADFPNFRDYMFKAMGRFDYSPQDCFDFHDSVATAVVPILDELVLERKKNMGIENIKPWDKAVDLLGRPPLKPFNNSEELLNKSIECFTRIDPYLGACLQIMKEMGHFDLESRKGKAPGGYNYPLAESGAPFIFMNATSTLRDLVTLMHEGGHAVHSFLAHPLELNKFKSTPSEVAELASMAMELISMDHWDLFFDNPEDLKRAKQEHLEQIIETLPWVSVIDKFQHWIYENPEHTEGERTIAWSEILEQFSDTHTDWEGLQHFREKMWQKQLHLFEVPFYYIEYGMAQLGAIAIWKNYRENKTEGLQGYMNALKLGYTRTIPEIYEAAGIKFDFSSAYIKNLTGFVKEELNSL